MPFEILEKKKLADQVYYMVVSAPRLAAKRRAGQFVIVRPRENSERIPLTMVSSSPEGGVALIFQTVGYTTLELASLEVGESVQDVLGPLGQPTEIPEKGSVICVGGGIGTAPLLPIASALKEAGNHVLGILGARTKELLILEEEMRAACQEVKIATDDGSYGEKGLVTNLLRRELEKGGVDHVYIVGPIPMMKACAELTKEFNVPATASLNSIMIDGTGMCGGCRVSVGGKTRYTCVDGPEFPAAEIDFDELRRRSGIYREYEHVCRLRAQEEGLV
ncbi:sulfide/dihydroorotate dehydrogenase-like FAD/NAD-binding protein [bacterium]|nr:sulfide/dihydroorotate dehydrogenase-like FAD/NAD-binding protein [bacterium]